MKNFDTTIPFEESSTSYGFGRIRVPIIFVRTRPLNNIQSSILYYI